VDPADLRGAHLAAERRQHRALLVAVGIGVAVVLIIAFPGARPAAAREPVVELASDYPVPPLDLVGAHEVVPSEGPEPSRAAHPGAVGEGERVAMFEFFKGFGVTFGTMFKKVVTEEYPETRRPPRPATTAGTSSTGTRRAGEVRRLRAVRLGLPGRRDLRRGRRQHRGGALLAR
jgi:hypothetical protein